MFGGILSKSFGYSLTGGVGSSSSQTSLKVHTVNEKSTAFLAWTVRIAYTDDGGRRQISRIFAEATRVGDLVRWAP